jgi:SAM-dependent methyltransferase
MSFSTFRRHYLDRCLAATEFSGDVLDIGGKKENKKGEFRPPLGRCRSWRYLNVDAASKPDFLASADKIPLDGATLDWVLLSEVLEHLERPEQALAEAARVLRGGGKLALSVPFLYPVHGDPYDYQRWTPEKLRRSLGMAGFTEISVRPMGGLLSALADIFEAWCQAHYGAGRSPPFPARLTRKLLRTALLPLLLRRDPGLPYADAVTGGYFVTARKPE